MNGKWQHNPCESCPKEIDCFYWLKHSTCCTDQTLFITKEEVIMVRILGLPSDSVGFQAILDKRNDYE